MRLINPIQKVKVPPEIKREMQQLYEESRQAQMAFNNGDIGDTSHYMHGVARLSRELADKLFELAGIETDEIMREEFGHPRN